ncbi:hypothetical protein Thi970DRAFT_01678 [Thiorhodovibrio frisius]|uniref:Nif11 domain-containing protein n=2 Tax=Thiorhodovibrio frisius TaxID=631362 RepID=H8Z1M2_9GAMM|nr:hypothetical protein Thi970DRAFT_01678 [Thiorhodovibrio frisius]WPL24053.1 hypothetical protein Thiofri_04265 [Thiorhodovibrio frisius]
MAQTAKMQRLEDLFTQVKEKAEADAEFQQRVRARPAEALNEINCNNDEARQLLEIIQAKITKERSENRALSQDELDGVAGGLFFDDLWQWLKKALPTNSGGGNCSHC